MGEAGPEAILPLRRGADGKLGIAGGSGGGNVIIQNYGAQVETEKRTNDQGGIDTVVIVRSIEKMIAGNVSNGSGDLYRAMSGQFASSKSR